VESLVPVDPDTTLSLGDGLKVRFIEGRHSTLQCCALAIEWHSGDGSITRVLHTSDFKIDENLYEDGQKGLDIYENAFDGEPVDFLLIDSTNAEREGHTVSEKAVMPNLKRLIEQQEGRVYVSMFSSNVYRMSALMGLSASLGRAVCLAGRSFNTVHRICSDKGLYAKYCPPLKGSQILSPEELMRRPAHQQLIICSGSQGEQRSVLNRLSMGKHPEFQLQPGDAVILSSKTIPGNEKSISRMINGLLRQGARVYWGDYAKVQAGGPIHGSGHARRDEIRAVMNAVRPRHIIPVHGELRQLRACADLALETSQDWSHECQVHVCENLTLLNFEFDDHAERWNLIGKESLPYGGRVLRFENFTAHSLDPFLRVRKRSAQGGVVSLCIDSMGRIQVQMAGVLPESSQDSDQNLESLEDSLHQWASQQFKFLQREGVFLSSNKRQHEDNLADEAARYVRRITGVRPFVMCHLIGL
jgi:mRNA degradation ribonuclease J1/J2